MVNVSMIDAHAKNTKKKKKVDLTRELVVISMSSLSTLNFQMIFYQ